MVGQEAAGEAAAQLQRAVRAVAGEVRRHERLVRRHLRRLARHRVRVQRRPEGDRGIVVDPVAELAVRRHPGDFQDREQRRGEAFGQVGLVLPADGDREVDEVDRSGAYPDGGRFRPR